MAYDKCDNLSFSAYILTYVGTIIIVDQASPFLFGNFLLNFDYVCPDSWQLALVCLLRCGSYHRVMRVLYRSNLKMKKKQELVGT